MVLFIILLYYFSEIVYNLSSGKSGITLGKKLSGLLPVCKNTHGNFVVGFKKGEEIIFAF